MKLLIAFFLLILSFNMYAQQPSFTQEWVTYTNNYSETGVNAGLNAGIAVDHKNNVYITKGIIGSQENTTLGSLSKFSPDGELLWTTVYYGETTGLAIDNNGDLVIAGYTSWEEGIATQGVFQENIGGVRDAYLMKYNSEGERLWGTYFGGADYEADSDYASSYFMGLEITFDNSIVWSCGMKSEDMATIDVFQSENNGADYVISKFDGNGQRDWTTYYGTNEAERHNISGLKINESGIFIVGRIQNGILPNSYYDTTGNYVFESESYEIYLTKFDYTGNREWSRYIPKGNGRNYMRRHGLIISDDNLYITYTTTSTDLGTTGTAFPNPIGSNYPGILMKLDLEGDISWSTYLPENNYTPLSNTTSIYSDQEDRIYVMGSIPATDYDFLEGFNSEIQGSFTPYLLNFDDEGNVLWGSYFGETNNDENVNFGMSAQDDFFYFYGTTEGSNNIATPGVFQEDPNGTMFDSFLSKYKQENLQVDTYLNSSLKVFPNPTSGILNISLNNDIEFPVEANFYTILGQLVKTKNIQNSKTPINLSGFNPGIYFLKLKIGNKVTAKKIVVN